jgi:prophage regulatory protein
MNDPANDPEWLTVKQAAEYAQVNIGPIYAAMGKGYLETMGGDGVSELLISSASLDRWLGVRGMRLLMEALRVRVLQLETTLANLITRVDSLQKAGRAKSQNQPAAAERPARSTALPQDDNALVRLPQVLSVIPISRSAWWNGIREGRYPKPIRLGTRTVAWCVADIRAVLTALTDGEGRR